MVDGKQLKMNSNTDFRWGNWILFFFLNLPNPSSRTMALRSTLPLTEMRTRNIPGGKGRPEPKADNLYEPIVWEMWRPQHLYGTSRPLTGIALTFLTCS
jgi:hypothetical protein